MKRTLALIPLAIFLASSLLANPLENPGFEDGSTGWTIKDTMSKVTPDAAHDGKVGLRIVDEDTGAGSSVMSVKLPVQPGQQIKLTFWARTEGNFAGVYFWFGDAAGKLIKDPSQRVGAGSPVCAIDKTDGVWNEYSLTATAPEGAESVGVWIHSYGGGTGTVDIDDFDLEGIAEGAAPLGAVTPIPAPVSLPAREKPPVIVLKVDDFRPDANGQVNGLWRKFTDFIESRKLKAGIGMIMVNMPNASPEFVQWVKDRQASGNFEFWFHAWDHGVHEVNGVKYNEFNDRPFEEQKKRFDDSQALAMEKFGFPFATFGPPGGASNGFFDASTLRVMAEDPHMKVWLYPQPLDEQGGQLEAAGKIIILDRVWAVNLESKVGQPDFQKFLQGYAKSPDRAYFVLQGHPTHWGDPAKWNEFVKIIDFLTAQKAMFLTPSEYAAAKARHS